MPAAPQRRDPLVDQWLGLMGQQVARLASMRRLIRTQEVTLLHRNGWLIIVSVGVTAILTALAISLVSRSISRPVRRLVATAEAISQGDRSARAAVRGQNEIAQLAESFNRMTDQLVSAQARTEDRVRERTAELTAANEALRSSEERFRRLLESAPDGIVTVDGEGRILMANEQVEKLSGYSRPELIGNRVEMLVPQRVRDVHVHHRQGYMAHPRTRPMGVGLDLYLQRKDGSEMPVEISLSPMQTAQGRVVMAILRDITERRKAQQAIRQLNADLERRANELQAANQELEAFAYSVSHDLRAPLRGVDAYAKILLESQRDKLDEDGRFVLNQVVESAQEMGRLIDDLLAFSRMGRREMLLGTVDMDDLVRSVCQELARAHPDRHLDFEIAPLPPAQGDQAMIREVLRNLLGNAVKFTTVREAARIEVSALSGEQAGGDREVGQDSVVYRVRDNGVGFDPHYRHKLFRVFQRLHTTAQFEGTGVGLALVKRIIDRHGGHVWAEGELDRGAAFYFSLKKATSGAPLEMSEAVS